MKVAVAMSGGIDSSVTAVLLKKAGHDVAGITARFVPHNDFYDELFNQSVNDSKKIAELYDFSHYVYDFSAEFNETVIEYFCREYISGRTPNPCIICNRFIKFESLITASDKLGYDMLATGHYAIKKESGSRYFLSMSPDRSKDQSYFLFMLTQKQLSRSLFPLGGMSKDDIRRIASDFNLPVKDKPDSQEICFIPDNDYISFIEENKGLSTSIIPGDIINSAGDVIGKHNGIYRYTIGQRRGMGISASEPLYVTAIDPATNRITAGTRNELYVAGFDTVNSFDMKYKITDEVQLMIKARSTQKPVPGTVTRNGDTFKVTYKEPQTGISPGQGGVFYDDTNDIVGGGLIGRTF